jgi:predicted nucleotidyltransferase
MRLTPKEVRTIQEAFQTLSDGAPYSLYLFGSRADDSKKGGDIDLLVVTTESSKERFVSLKTRIRSRIFERLPEQKIDITVATEQELEHDEFLKSLTERIRL